MAETVVEVRGLRFAYAATEVLRGIDLRVEAGEIFGLVGADGAGKSTLLRVLVGQLSCETGEVSVLGEPPGSAALRQRIAYMPQGFGLYLDLSVEENLAFFADMHALDAQRATRHIGDLLERTGLQGFEDRRAGDLSGGMMQKLALACALISEPRVMFLDEPTTGVDPVSRRAFWHLLDGVRADGVAIVYATANMDEAERCDRVALLDGGRLDRQGAPFELIDQRAVLLGITGEGIRALRARVRALPGVRLAFAVGREIKVWLEAGEDAGAFGQRVAVLAPGARVDTLTPSLHDAALYDLAAGQGRAGHEHDDHRRG